MEYIEVDFLPFKINKKYNEAIKEIDSGQRIKLFNKYDAQLELWSNAFDDVYVMIKFDEINIIEDVNNILLEKYGKPKYIVYKGRKVWKINESYVTHGIGTFTNDEKVQIITIKCNLSIGIFDYEKYIEINKIYERIKNEFNFQESTNISIDYYNNLIICFDSLKYHYKVIIKNENIIIKILTNDVNKKIVQKRVKYKCLNLIELYDIINTFFEDRIIYDESLYKLK